MLPSEVWVWNMKLYPNRLRISSILIIVAIFFQYSHSCIALDLTVHGKSNIFKESHSVIKSTDLLKGEFLDNSKKDSDEEPRSECCPCNHNLIELNSQNLSKNFSTISSHFKFENLILSKTPISLFRPPIA